MNHQSQIANHQCHLLVLQNLPDNLSLITHELPDSGIGEREQRVHLGSVERLCLGRALDFDEQSGGGLDDVHVHVRARVLGVGQVEHRRAADDADARGGDVVGDRHARE